MEQIRKRLTSGANSNQTSTERTVTNQATELDTNKLRSTEGIELVTQIPVSMTKDSAM
jgi:hypothetical protein